MIRTLFLSFILVLIAESLYCQVFRHLVDMKRIELLVDSASFQEVGMEDYRINVFLTGFYNNDTVNLCKCGIKISNCTATTFNDKSIGEPVLLCKDFNLIVARNRESDYKIAFNGDIIAIPIVYGYGILLINIDYDRVRREVLSCKLTYSNRNMPIEF